MLLLPGIAEWHRSALQCITWCTAVPAIFTAQTPFSYSSAVWHCWVAGEQKIMIRRPRQVAPLCSLLAMQCSFERGGYMLEYLPRNFACTPHRLVINVSYPGELLLFDNSRRDEPWARSFISLDVTDKAFGGPFRRNWVLVSPFPQMCLSWTHSIVFQYTLFRPGF